MNRLVRWGMYAVCGAFVTAAGCLDTGKNAGGKSDITKEAVASYLAEYNLNASGNAAEIANTVREGGKFRKKVKDEKGKPTMLTAWFDRDKQDIFCITFYRDEVCPECKGTGRRALPMIMDTKISGVSLTCLKCDGKGTLPNQFHKRCWVLGDGDYGNASEAQANDKKYSFQNSPAGTEEKVKLLSSDDPMTRLNACIWLDQNYIKPGVFFRDILPILDRARYSGPVGANDLSRKIMGRRPGEGLTVYQFWAAKGLKAEYARAYYRIYIEDESGKVVRTEFAPDAGPAPKPRQAAR